MATAFILFVDKRTREFTTEELPEHQIRKMNRVERIHDLMLEGKDDHLGEAAILMIDGYAVYRIIN